MEESEETAGTSIANRNGAPPVPPEAGLIDALAVQTNDRDQPVNDLGALDFSEDNEAAMLSHARRNAQVAAQVALDKAKRFDEMYKSEQAVSKENYVLDEDEEMENEGAAAMDSLVGVTAADKAKMGNIDSKLGVLHKNGMKSSN